MKDLLTTIVNSINTTGSREQLVELLNTIRDLLLAAIKHIEDKDAIKQISKEILAKLGIQPDACCDNCAFGEDLPESCQDEKPGPCRGWRPGRKLMRTLRKRPLLGKHRGHLTSIKGEA